MRNEDIRFEIKASRLYYHEISECLGMHESTFYRLLRSQLTARQKEQILKTIRELKRTKYTELLSIS
jgi:predicted transcriptional regulator